MLALSSADLMPASSVFQRSSWKCRQLTPTVFPAASAGPASDPDNDSAATTPKKVRRIEPIASPPQHRRYVAAVRDISRELLPYRAGVRKSAGRSPSPACSTR